MSISNYLEVEAAVLNSTDGDSPSVAYARKEAELAFRQLREPIYRYIAIAHRHPAEAEEITQDVFLRLYICLQRGDKIRDIRVWAFTVARNSAISALRKKRSFGASIVYMVSDKFQRLVPDLRPTMEQTLIARGESEEAQERVLRIRDAVGFLTDLQRECFCMRVEGFCYREIAETVGVSLQAAVNACERAASNIRRRVKP